MVDRWQAFPEHLQWPEPGGGRNGGPRFCPQRALDWQEEEMHSSRQMHIKPVREKE